MKTVTSSPGVILFVLLVALGFSSLHAGHRRHSTTIFGGLSVEKGSGQLATEQRTVGSFDRIESNIGADISVSIGKPQSISVSFDDNLIEYVTTEIKGRTLIVETSHSLSSTENCRIKIVVPRLEAIVVNGSGTIEADGLDGDRFSVELDGSADINLNGRVEELGIEVNGSGNVDTRDLAAAEVKVDINGSGDAKIMAREVLTASVNGSGSVFFWGDPGHVVKDVSGSGRIVRR